MYRIPGSLEVAGLTPIQAIEIVRGLKGLNIVGGDVAEVSFSIVNIESCAMIHIVILQTNPLNDPCGITSLMVANLMFEMLCILPGVKYVDMESMYRTDLI